MGNITIKFHQKTKYIFLIVASIVIALILLVQDGQNSTSAEAASSDYPPGLLVYSYDMNRVFLRSLSSVNGFGTVENFDSLIQRRSSLAAINGTYFDAYQKDETKRFPYGLMINSGKIIRGGSNPSVWVDSNNKGFVTRLKVNVTLGIREYKQTSKGKVLLNSKVKKIWGINQFWGERNQTQNVIFTSDWGPRLQTSAGVKIVVRQGTVVRITRDPVDIPTDGFIYYDGDSKQWKSRNFYKEFKIGYKLVLFTSVTDLENKRTYATSKIRFALGAGPVLLRNGNVSIDNRGDGFKDPKILTGDGRRSFIGFDNTGKVVIGSSSRTTLPRLADNLRKRGMVSVLNVDGGAGSAIYANKQIVVNPDRRLSNIIMILNR